MSTWGGSGLADGMWRGIDVVLRDRQNKQAQSNADRDFAFRKEQAERAQANADRQMGNQELAAERAQANADRDYALKQRSADLDASLKSRDMELRGILGQLDANLRESELASREQDREFQRQMQSERLAGAKEDRALRRELGTAEIEGKKEDRALRREESKGRREDAAADRALRERELDLQETRDERTDNFRDRQFNEAVRQADREYKLKKEAQDWENRINEQKRNAFELENEKLTMEVQKEKEKSDLIESTGQKQFAQAVYQILSWKDMGLLKKTTIYETQPDGSEKPMEVLALPESTVRTIFGTVGNLSDVKNVYITETDEGPKIGFQKFDDQGNATSNLLDESGMHAALMRGSNNDKAFADSMMQKFAESRDLGLYKDKKKVDTDEKIREVQESGRGLGNIWQTYQTALNNIDELIPYPSMRDKDYKKKMEIAERKRQEFRDGYMSLLRRICVDAEGASGDTGRTEAPVRQIRIGRASAEGGKVELPQTYYRPIDANPMTRVKKGSFMLQNGKIIAPGMRVETPYGVLVNENGKVYVVSR